MSTSIPKQGRPAALLLEEMESFKSEDAPWKQGRTWSMVYQVDEPHNELLRQASALFLSESYVNPFAFPSLQRMEREVIAMTAGLLNGGEEAVGTMTSGGTESILLALYTYRERARQRGEARDELIVPASIHPAFEKAAYLLGLKVIKCAVNENGQADVGAMQRRIGRRSLLLAASAPAYPHGLLDPLPELSEVAQRHGLPLHVDACIGGFMLPWVERLYPEQLPAWDFRLPGVTSISADTHKFAYGAKGSSVLLYRSMDYLRYQFFLTTDWAGGVYASAGLLGSRSGGPIASAWAAMNSLGEAGYMAITQRIMEGFQRLRQGIAAMPELEIIGQPCMNILAYTTRGNRPDVFVLADYLEGKGWQVDRQQRPNCIHITVMQHNLTVLEDYLSDLKAAVDFALSHPEAKGKGNAALYGLMARLPFRGLVGQQVRQLFEQLYGRGLATDADEGGRPNAAPQPAAWMRWLNRLLSRLPFGR